jgi:hypothetical protein
MPAIKWFAGMARSCKFFCGFQDERRSVVTMNFGNFNGGNSFDQSPGG